MGRDADTQLEVWEPKCSKKNTHREVSSSWSVRALVESGRHPHAEGDKDGDKRSVTCEGCRRGSPFLCLLDSVTRAYELN